MANFFFTKSDYVHIANIVLISMAIIFNVIALRASFYTPPTQGVPAPPGTGASIGAAGNTGVSTKNSQLLGIYRSTRQLGYSYSRALPFDSDAPEPNGRNMYLGVRSFMFYNDLNTFQNGDGIGRYDVTKNGGMVWGTYAAGCQKIPDGATAIGWMVSTSQEFCDVFQDCDAAAKVTSGLYTFVFVIGVIIMAYYFWPLYGTNVIPILSVLCIFFLMVGLSVFESQCALPLTQKYNNYWDLYNRELSINRVWGKENYKVKTTLGPGAGGCAVGAIFVYLVIGISVFFLHPEKWQEAKAQEAQRESGLASPAAGGTGNDFIPAQSRV